MKELVTHERIALTNQVAKDYRKLSRKEKAIVLDDYCQKSGYNRKYASNLLSNWNKEKLVRIDNKLCRLKGDHKRRKTNREPYYGEHERGLLFELYELYNQPCGKRLTASIKRDWKQLKRKGVCKDYPDESWEKISGISAATIDRLTAEYRKKYQLKGLSSTASGSLLKKQIPIRTFADWNEKKPGFFEMDTVSHDGGAASGDWCFTLNTTDIHTGWCEMYGLRNKAQKWTFEAIKRMIKECPIPVKGIDTDNGSEFINNHMLRFTGEEEITLTRARAYKKNDGCYIEQKNNAVIREYVGCFRIDTENQLQMLNKLYDSLRLYYNYFQPQRKLIEKKRIGSRVKKIYDDYQTPYDRILTSKDVGREVKKRVRAIYRTLDIRSLKNRIDESYARLYVLCTGNISSHKG